MSKITTTKFTLLKLSSLSIIFLIGAGCFRSIPQEKMDDADTIISKSLNRLDPESIIRSGKSLHMSGHEEGRMIKVPSTENYPVLRDTFECYDDPEHFYLRSARGVQVSSPQGSWHLSPRGQGFKSDSQLLNHMNLISLLERIRLRTPVRDPEHQDKLWIIVPKNPLYKISFTPNYQIEKVEVGNTVWEYNDYRMIAGGYLPTKIIATTTSPFSVYQQVWTIEKIEVGFNPKANWFKKPSALQPFPPALTIGNWKNVGMMSRNLVAMRKIYGQKMNFCLNLAFRTPNGDELIMNQITFANEESAEYYLKNPAADDKIAARWRIGKFVQELEGPMTLDKQAFIDEIKRRKEVIKTPGMPQ